MGADLQSSPLNLADVLGADPGFLTQCITIYIPNKDRHGEEIGNQRKWVLEAMKLFSEINGGATAMPPVEGGWRDDDGTLIWDEPVLVYSYVRSANFMQSLPRLREFLHRLGRETDQGEVAIEWDDQFFLIRKFDAETEP